MRRRDGPDDADERTSSPCVESEQLLDGGKTLTDFDPEVQIEHASRSRVVEDEPAAGPRLRSS
jgi:hypothetical protein